MSRPAISIPGLRARWSHYCSRHVREQGAALLLVSHDRDMLAKFSRVEDFAKLNRVAPDALP